MAEKGVHFPSEMVSFVIVVCLFSFCFGQWITFCVVKLFKLIDLSCSVLLGSHVLYCHFLCQNELNNLFKSC